LIAPIFLKLADYLKVYATYCNNQVVAFNAVEHCRKKFPSFGQFLEKQLNHNPTCKGLQLISFLIKPVQRICKYPLLLRELVKHTPTSHPDKKPLGEALEKINGTVDSINESKRAAENLDNIIGVQNRINARLDLLKPTRRFIMDANLQLIKETSSKKAASSSSANLANVSQTTWFLFNDILLYCKKSTKRLQSRKSKALLEWKAWIPLHLASVEPLDDLADGYQGLHFGFKLCHKTQKDYLLFASSENQKIEWIQAIDKYSKKQKEQKKRKKLAASMSAPTSLASYNK